MNYLKRYDKRSTIQCVILRPCIWLGNDSWLQGELFFY